MRTQIATFLVVFLGLPCVSCQDRSQAKVTVSVVNDVGRSVDQAVIETDIFDYWKSGNGFGQDVYKKLSMRSNQNGVAVFEVSKSRGEMIFVAKKPGYYNGSSGYKGMNRNDGRWLPWNPTVEIELKRVLDPIPLIAKKVCEGYGHYVALPADNAGFDLEVADWTEPHGKGKVADIKFRFQGHINDPALPYDTRMTVSFSNAKDGLIIHEGDPTKGSQLRLPYLAPEEGYEAVRSWRKARLAAAATGPNKGIGQLIDESKPNENYFLRVRTVLNENDDIISAHYAKIYLGFQWEVTGVIRFQYYFNPTANDRNLEFDPSRNLIKASPGNEVIDP